MTTYSLDAESFIKEIKKHRKLWDITSDGHKYRTRDKQASWEEVAKVFIPDFENMKDIEKNEVYRRLHGKWRNIRDAYVRNLKRKDGKVYLYAKQLSFLSSRYSQTYNQINHTSEDDTTDDEKHEESNQSMEIMNSDDENSTISNLKRRRIETRSRETIEFVDTPSLQLQPVDAPTLQTVDTSYVAEDEDRSFFDSLLPAVRQFDLDQKLEFRCGVIKLIKQIRSESNNDCTNNFKKEFIRSDYN